MRRLQTLCIALLILQSAIAHAAEPPLAISASVQGATLTVVVFTTAPTSAQVRVSLPPGWTADTPLVVNLGVRVAAVLTWHLHPGAGLGIIRVTVADGRGNHAQDTAYSVGTTIESRAQVGARLWMAVVRR